MDAVLEVERISPAGIAADAHEAALAEILKVAKAVKEGKFDVKADGAKLFGPWAEAVDAVNQIVDGVQEPLHYCIGLMERISVNDFTSTIRNTYKGDFEELVSLIETSTDKLLRLQNAAEEISHGDLSRLDEFRAIGNGTGRRSAQDKLAPAFIKMMENQNLLIDWLKKMYEAHKAGDSDFAIDPGQFEGAYKTVAESINAGFMVYVSTLRTVLDILASYSEGDFSPIMMKLPGKHARIKERVDIIRDTLLGVSSELVGLTEAALAGKLSYRADSSKFSGEFKKIVDGVNKTLDAVVDPVKEASAVLETMAHDDLTARVKGDYQGDHALIKNSLNTAIEGLSELVVQVVDAVEQIGSASNQISSSAQAVAEGASEQASSIEEISSSLEEITGMTKNNAENAANAQGLAEEETGALDEGKDSLNRMTAAIQDIKSSSDQTAKIVKTIDDIAFQTNLLALNAAVEAARAGEAGRGFAVVAEEVRNLALRSADAAKTTAGMIDESVKKADNGVAMVKEVTDALHKVRESATKVNQLVAEIAAASEEQAKAVEQVNVATAQMDKVTQSNASSAEESASASEELSSQAKMLQDVVNNFKVSRDSRKTAREAGDLLSGLDLATLQQLVADAKRSRGVAPEARRAGATTKQRPKLTRDPKAKFPLDESEFSEF